MTTQCVQVKLELGHKATLRDKATPQGFTHDWAVFVRGPDGSQISHFVEKVTFLLHESFPKPKRVIREPPYQVEECGYAGFTMPIEVYFRNKEEPKKVQFMYDMFLPLEGPPVNHIRCEKLTFKNPTEDFRIKLLKGDGVGIIEDASGSPLTIIEQTKPAIPQTPSIGKDGFSGVAQKKPKMHASASKESQKSSSKPIKEPKDGKPSHKEPKTKDPNKVVVKRASTGSSAHPEPVKKRKRSSSTKEKEHTSSKPPKIKTPSGDKVATDGVKVEKKSSGEKIKPKEENKVKKIPKTPTKSSSSSQEKLFNPEIKVDHRSTPDTAMQTKKNLPPFEDELSTEEIEEPNSPSSRSSFSSIPCRPTGTLGTLMKELVDDNDDDEDISIPFKRESPIPYKRPDSDDSSSSDMDFDEILRQKAARKDSSSVKEVPKKTEVKVKKVPTSEKKISKKTESKVKNGEGKKSLSKQKSEKVKVTDGKSKSSDAKVKTGEVKVKSSDQKIKSSEQKTKSVEKKESKGQVVTKHKSVDNKSKKVEKVRAPDENQTKPPEKVRSNSKTKSMEKAAKNVDKGHIDGGVTKINEAKQSNMDYLYELVDLHKRLMNLRDREKLQKVVDLIGETGSFKITDKTFDFDLCSLDKSTVRKLQEYVPPL